MSYLRRATGERFKQEFVQSSQLRRKAGEWSVVAFQTVARGTGMWCRGMDDDESALRVFERKVLRKIYGSLRIDDGEYRSRCNDELYEIYDEIHKVQQTKR